MCLVRPKTTKLVDDKPTKGIVHAKRDVNVDYNNILIASLRGFVYATDGVTGRGPATAAPVNDVTPIRVLAMAPSVQDPVDYNKLTNVYQPGQFAYVGRDGTMMRVFRNKDQIVKATYRTLDIAQGVEQVFDECVHELRTYGGTSDKGLNLVDHIPVGHCGLFLMSGPSLRGSVAYGSNMIQLVSMYNTSTLETVSVSQSMLPTLRVFAPTGPSVNNDLVDFIVKLPIARHSPTDNGHGTLEDQFKTRTIGSGRECDMAFYQCLTRVCEIMCYYTENVCVYVKNDSGYFKKYDCAALRLMNSFRENAPILECIKKVVSEELTCDSFLFLCLVHLDLHTMYGIPYIWLPRLAAICCSPTTVGDRVIRHTPAEAITLVMHEIGMSIASMTASQAPDEEYAIHDVVEDDIVGPTDEEADAVVEAMHAEAADREIEREQGVSDEDAKIIDDHLAEVEMDDRVMDELHDEDVRISEGAVVDEFSAMFAVVPAKEASVSAVRPQPARVQQERPKRPQPPAQASKPLSWADRVGAVTQAAPAAKVPAPVIAQMPTPKSAQRAFAQRVKPGEGEWVEAKPAWRPRGILKKGEHSEPLRSKGERGQQSERKGEHSEPLRSKGERGQQSERKGEQAEQAEQVQPSERKEEQVQTMGKKVGVKPIEIVTIPPKVVSPASVGSTTPSTTTPGRGPAAFRWSLDDSPASDSDDDEDEDVVGIH
jgi:hypothetical protein